MKLQPKMYGPDVRQAFEVEDIGTRQNFTFIYEPTTKSVEMFDTSIKVGKKLDMIYREQDSLLIPTFWAKGNANRLNINPLDQNTAYGYFKTLYDKSLKDFQVCFLGWVNPDTIEPLEWDEEAE